MARNLTPEQIGQRYTERTGMATGAWVDGINAVTESPGAAAARQKDKWAQNTAAAKDKFAANAGAVDVASWKRSATDKQSRYAQGTAAGAQNMVAFQRQFQPFQSAVTAKVRSMPSTTPEQRIQRMVAQATETAKFNYKK